MTNDLKSAERKGTPAKKSRPASKVQLNVQLNVQVKEQVKERVMEQQSAVGQPPSPTAPIPPNETTTAAGQEGTLIIRMERTFTVLGVGNGHTIFKDAEGAVFHLDPATGDKRSVVPDYFLTLDDSKGERSAGRIKCTTVMIVSILGADAHGNTVMRNARNETFTLDPKTGTKVLIKWPK